MTVYVSLKQIFSKLELQKVPNDLEHCLVLLVWTLIISTVVYLASKVFTRHPLRDNKGNTIPDGPTGLPILGSFPFLTRYPELTLDHWAKQFGPLYSMWLGNQLFVVVSSSQVVKDLMVTNGAIFSSRKEMFLKSQIILAGRGITATPYNNKWRTHRRLALIWLNKSAVKDHTHILDLEATVLIHDLYKNSKGGSLPINPQPYVGRFSMNNMLTITCGRRTDTINDPLVSEVLRLSREFMNCTGPVSNLIDFVPILQKFPLPMKKRAKCLHDDLIRIYGGMITDIQERINNKEQIPDSLIKTLLLAKQQEGLDFLDLVILCSGFMIGGVETTASVMHWFSALIPAHPDIQAKAQAELDHIVGRNRLPNIEDQENLPYIRAIIKEVERCYNPLWLGTPHVNIQDFIYCGNFIPKDTVIIMNTYTMHHDPQRYPDPYTFNPNRYIDDATLSSESANSPNPVDRDHWIFGAGRRICPGMWFAEREIFLAISRMLWAFTMHEIPGAPIDLKEYDGLSGRSPVPFRIRICPRHDQVEKVLGL